MSATAVERSAVAAPAAETTVALVLGADVPPEHFVTVVARAGARPVAVTNSAEGLAEVVAGTPPDIVLLDLALGRAQPREFSALALAHPSMAVVVLCGGESDESLAGALALGVKGFVERDGGALELGAVLAAARAGRYAVAPQLVDRLLTDTAARLRAGGGATLDRKDRGEALQAVLAAPGALFPVFQPVDDLRTGRRLGWLALTRFRDASPQETGRRFAEARELGLTEDIEVAAAAAALAQLDRIPVPGVVIVKASCNTVLSPRLHDLLDATVAPRVVLELGAAAELEARAAFAQAVARLRHRGARFAVDETGAGFGPLDQVLDLSPAFVRLAGGLVRGIDSDRTRRALALTVISFASHLGARVIADQIETAEELDALRRLGVSYGVGFHIGRPQELPAPLSGAPAADGAATDLPADLPAGHTLVRWARLGGSEELGLPGRALASFEGACVAVLRLLEQRLPGATAYVAQLDHHSALLRIVDAGAAAGGAVEVGAAFPLDGSRDELAATGQMPQVGPARDGAAAGGTPCPAEHWAVVPFAGGYDRPLATLSVAAGEPLGDADLELLRTASGALAGALEREHGQDPETVATALRELAGRDRFTGLLNAHRFREVLAESGARALAQGAMTYVVSLTVTNLDGLSERLGQAVGGLVLKDVARSLALEAERVDAIARVDATTFGCILFGRRASEAEYFLASVQDRIHAAGRRRGATVELRTGSERLGLRASGGETWGAAVERAFSA
jgi:EAL domain-containing protein (putative c-di-GMP-specific phosphodiesterase class I)/GGDEF domain-containing protein/AmiR/NasT family two-component response regulator